eukprot:UN27791
MESQCIFGNSPIDIMKSTAPSLRLLGDENAGIRFWLSASNNATSSVATSITKQSTNDAAPSSLFGGEMIAGQLCNIGSSAKGGIGIKANSLGDEKIVGGAFFRHEPSGLGLFLSCADNLTGLSTGWTLLTRFQHDNNKKEAFSENNGTSIWLGSSLQFLPQELLFHTNVKADENIFNLN